jgi:hypothetical protein
MSLTTEHLRLFDEHAFGARVEAHRRGLRVRRSRLHLPATLSARVGRR